MTSFNFQERGGLASLLNKMLCELATHYAHNPGQFYDEIVMGGLFTNRGLVNNKNHNLYPDILKTAPHHFQANMSGRLSQFSFDIFGIRNFDQVIAEPYVQMLLETYFNFSDAVVAMSEQIMKQHKIDLTVTTFVWARKTDKVTECTMPSAAEYNLLLDIHGAKSTDVIVQTDERAVLDEFTREGIVHRYIDVLPLSSGAQGFHHTDGCLSEADFQAKFSMSKVEYNVRFMALIRIASLCKTVIISPGNLQCLIPLMRRSTRGCVVPASVPTHGAHKKILPSSRIMLPGNCATKVVYSGDLSDSDTIMALLSGGIPTGLDFIFLGDRASARPDIFEQIMSVVATSDTIHYYGVPYGQEFPDVHFSAAAVMLSPKESGNVALLEQIRAHNPHVIVDYENSPSEISRILSALSKKKK